MRINIFLFLIIHSVCAFSDEYTVSDKVERDHQGRIEVIKRSIRFNSDEIIHREKAKLILYREVSNIFQFFGGYIDVFIHGVGKVDFINYEGKRARKYSEDAVVYGLSKQFSQLYFYDNDVGMWLDASGLFPQFERGGINNSNQMSEADRKLKEIIHIACLEQEKKLRLLQQEAEERKKQQKEAEKHAQELQKRLEEDQRPFSFFNFLWR